MENTSAQNNKVSLWLVTTVALLTMVGPFTIDTYLPSFPDIEAEYHVTRAMMSQTLGIYLAAAAFFTLVWGPLSDRIGRRYTILGTLIIYVTASIGCALAGSYSTFLAYRILQGAAASGGMIAGRAMVRDSHDAQTAHRTISYVMMLFALAPAIAPVIGGWLHDLFGWRSVFYFLALYGISMWILTLRFLGETLPKEHRQSIHPIQIGRLYRDVLVKRRFLFLVFTLGTAFGGLFLYIAGSPTVIYDFLGLGVDSFAVQFIPMTSGIIIGSFVSSRLTHHFNAQTLVTTSIVILGLACSLNLAQAWWLPINIFTLIAPQVVYAFGIAFLMPGITVMAMDCFPQNRGAATAVQSFVQMLTTSLVVSKLLPALHATVAHFALGQAALFGAAALLWIGVTRTQSPELRQATQ
jgi:DHA1 family bicyclomycin/chloramphenicol resistance-like MFS transporter